MFNTWSALMVVKWNLKDDISFVFVKPTKSGNDRCI